MNTSGGGFGRDAWLKGKNSLLRIIGMLLGSWVLQAPPSALLCEHVRPTTSTN